MCIRDRVCYLHLITDAYSHKIVGWVLSDTLRVSATINALQQAIEQAVEMTGDANLTGLIHHSDRGVQYCCDPYVALLPVSYTHLMREVEVKNRHYGAERDALQCNPPIGESVCRQCDAHNTGDYQT